MKNKLAAFAAVFAILSMLCAATALAVPPSPGEKSLGQQGGGVITATLHGDEWFHWYEASDGSVIMKGSDGAWRYARFAGGKLTALAARFALDARPAGAVTGKSLSGALKKSLPVRVAAKKNAAIARSSGVTAPAGPENLLVILVSFADISIRQTDAYWSDKMFGDYSAYSLKTDAHSSVDDYYREVSGGSFYFLKAAENAGAAGDGVIRVNLNIAHPAFGDNFDADSYKVASMALAAANPYINFAAFDSNGDGSVTPDELHVAMILAGYEQACGGTTQAVWAHTSGLDNPPLLDGVRVGGDYTEQGELQSDDGYSFYPATIGVLAHELGHSLGLPDLYDTNTNDYDDSEGVGVYSLMAYGSWEYNPQTGSHAGSSPAHLDAWCKSVLGFVKPASRTAGTYALNSLVTGGYNVLKVPTPDPKQYFLLENRQTDDGYDAALSQDILSGGIAIWHIDESVLDGSMAQYGGWYYVNDDETHKAVDLEEADEGIVGYSLLDENIAPGDAPGGKYDSLFRTGSPGCNSVFNSGTDPSSALYGGDSSGVSAVVTGPSADTMSVSLPPLIRSLTPGSASPQKQYRTVRWTCSADGNGVSYKFDVYLGAARVGGTASFTRQNWFDWTPETAGTYTVTASALADGMADPVTKSAAYVIQADATPPQIKAMAGGAALAAGAVTRFDVSATATDPDGGAVASQSYTVNGGGAVQPWPAAFTADGDYALAAADRAGNTAAFAFSIDKAPPAISAVSGALTLSSGMTAAAGVTVAVTDAHLASFSAVKDGAPYPWPAGGVFTETGVYAITAADGAGNASSFRFGVLPYADKLALTSSGNGLLDGDTVDGDVSVVLGDPGWQVKVNDFQPWSTGESHLFTAEGAYTVTATETGGSGTVTMRFTIDRSKPAITAKDAMGALVATGSMHGSAVTVTVSDLSKTALTAIKNGAACAWPAGGRFAADGNYAVTAIDLAGHTSSLAFSVDANAPVISAKAGGTAVANKGYSRANTAVTVSDMTAATKTAKKNGAAISWPAGSVFTAEGVYTVTATDRYSRTSTFVFTIDRTPPAISARQSSGAKAVSGKTYTKYVTVAISDKYLLMKSSARNGAAFVWPSGGRFAAKGTYVITAKDRAGNLVTFKFTIK